MRKKKVALLRSPNMSNILPISFRAMALSRAAWREGRRRGDDYCSNGAGSGGELYGGEVMTTAVMELGVGGGGGGGGCMEER